MELICGLFLISLLLLAFLLVGCVVGAGLARLPQEHPTARTMEEIQRTAWEAKREMDEATEAFLRDMEHRFRR